MKITLVIHKRLCAKKIYGDDVVWKDLYATFNEQDEQHGLYFYTYGNSKLPFYIGKSLAKSYKIVGRVWSELDDYKKGRYWLCKKPELLRDLKCFKEDYKAAENFFAPGTDPNNPEFDQAVEKLLEKTIISFAYLKNSAGETITEQIGEVETQLHNNLVSRYELERGWVGDGGKNLSKSSNKNHDLSFEYIVNPEKPEICSSIL